KPHHVSLRPLPIRTDRLPEARSLPRLSDRLDVDTFTLTARRDQRVPVLSVVCESARAVTAYLELRGKRQMQHPPYSRVVLREIRLSCKPADVDSGAEPAECVDESDRGERQGVAALDSADRNFVIVALAGRTAAQRELARRDVVERKVRGVGDVVVVALHDREAEVARGAEHRRPAAGRARQRRIGGDAGKIEL